MDDEQLYRTRRMSFLGLIAWVSVCLIIAGWFPHLGSNLHNFWVCVGLFGLASAVGLSECVKTEVKNHQKLLDTYISEARTDALTGIANRRAFDMELSSQCERLRSHGRPLALILIDVDHFKRFNDTHGHQAGDRILRMVAKVLQKTVGEAGLVTRYGGEEFAVVMPATKLFAALEAAQAIRSAVAGQQFEFRGQYLSVTVSLGVIEAMMDDEPDDLVIRADSALYAAKEAGRDRVFSKEGGRCREAYVEPLSIA